HLHSPALLETVAAELIIALYNDSLDSWDQGPAATEIEVKVIRELCTLFGYGPESDGVFTSGGSGSNLSAVIQARDVFCRRVLGRDVKKKGLPSEYGRLRLYTSEISHFSFDKAAHILGLGYDAVVHLPVDEKMRIDVSEAEEIIRRDAQAGLLPFMITATAGTTDFGSIDSVGDLRRIADEYGMYLHVDAAYGSGAIMSKMYRSRLGNLSLADSVTVDFHKMFLMPISCSCLLVKNRETLRTFELHADYLNREEDEEDGYINLVGKAIQTTRRADALKVFITFSVRGHDGYGEIIDRVISNAAYFYSRLKEDDAFITGPEPELSSVVFALRDGDEVNKKIRRDLMRCGTVIGQTVMNGRVMLKFTLLNPELTHEHIDELVCTIRSYAR
ncbi:MAG: pyridoxal phosphate-dependent decarboxylase family protein, partial [Bullifex sp.]